MRKWIAIAIMGVALVMGNAVAFADTYDQLITQPVNINVDGKEISSYDAEQNVDLPAVIVNGRTMMPLKRTFELFGVDTTWNGEERSITAETSNGTLWLQIDNSTAKLNGVDIQLDAAPTIFNSRTFVPLAFISQSMGVEPMWNAYDRSVTLNISEITRRRLPDSYLDEYLLTYEEIEDADYYYNLSNPSKSIALVKVEGSVEDGIVAASAELHVETTDFQISDVVGGYIYSFKDYDQNENHYVVRTIGNYVYLIKFKTFEMGEVEKVIKDFNGGRI